MLVASGVGQIRRTRGMSISELAARASITRVTVYAVERGDSVSLETLISIAAALDVPLSRIAAEAARLLDGVA